MEYYNFDDVVNVENGKELIFKSFEETFHFVMFSMSFGMIYPNPATERWRILAILFFWIVMIPAMIGVSYDVHLALKEKDMDTVFRHTIVAGPFFAQYLKMVIMFQKRETAKAVIDEMNRYFSSLNNSPLTYKRIAKLWLKTSFRYERAWSYCVLIGSFAFPIVAICKNTYSTLFDEEPRRYFIHEVRSPFGPPGSNYEFPYYEAAFIVTCIASCMYFVNFTGFDGFFVQCIMHTAMRMRICGEALKDAFGIDEERLRRKKLREAIQEHINICNFMDDTNDIFHGWISIATAAMVIHLCSCVFHLTQGNVLSDTEFMFGTSAAIAYLYMICTCGGLIKDQSDRFSDSIYLCGWERVPDDQSRRMLICMIARAQVPLQVGTMAYLVMDLELFVKIVKMAYSLYTFLEQT